MLVPFIVGPFMWFPPVLIEPIGVCISADNEVGIIGPAR
jgi:hypothetical protein